MIIPMENLTEPTNDEDIELKKANNRRPRQKPDQKESFGDRFKNRFAKKEGQVTDPKKEDTKTLIKQALLLVCSVAAVVAGIYGAYVVAVWALSLLVTGLTVGAFGMAVGGWFLLGFAAVPIWAGVAVAGICADQYHKISAERRTQAQELKTTVA